MGQRISRAKARLADRQQPFAMPPDDELRRRLPLVLHILYLLFNEGYAASGGNELARAELSDEAIRLTRAVVAAVPDDSEVMGLLALMLLTDARREARPATTVSSCPSTARTAPAGTAPASPRVSPWSPAPWSEAPWVSISCKLPSPLSTISRRPTRTRTGHNSSGSTGCWTGSPATPW